MTNFKAIVTDIKEATAIKKAAAIKEAAKVKAKTILEVKNNLESVVTDLVSQCTLCGETMYSVRTLVSNLSFSYSNVLDDNEIFEIVVEYLKDTDQFVSAKTGDDIFWEGYSFTASATPMFIVLK